MFEKKKIKGLDTPHPKYSAKISAFRKMRDFLLGESAVKAGDYLRYFHGMRTNENVPGVKELNEQGQNYKEDAPFFALTKEAVKKHTDTLFSDPPVYVVGENDAQTGKKLFSQLMPHDVTPLEFLRKYIYQLIGMGRVGIHAKLNSIGEAQWFLYPVENIINWEFDTFGNLIWIILEEKVEKRIDPEYPTKVEYGCQYRVIYKTTAVENGAIIPAVEEVVYAKQETKEGREDNYEFTEVPDSRYIVKSVENEYITMIPFKITNISGDPKDVEEPPLLGLASLNLQHFNTSAIRQLTNNFCGPPAFKAIGLMDSAKNGGMFVLPPGGLVSLEEGGDLDHIEFKAESVGALDVWIKEIEKKAAVLSDNFVNPDSKEVPTSYRTEQLVRRMGDSSLEQVSTAASMDITSLFRFSLANFIKEGRAIVGRTPEEQKDSKVRIIFNKRFTVKNIDAAALSAKARLVKEGLLPMQDFHADLIDSRLIPEDRSVEETMALIEEYKIYKRFEEVEQDDKTVEEEIKKDVSDNTK